MIEKDRLDTLLEKSLSMNKRLKFFSKVSPIKLSGHHTKHPSIILKQNSFFNPLLKNPTRSPSSVKTLSLSMSKSSPSIVHSVHTPSLSNTQKTQSATQISLNLSSNLRKALDRDLKQQTKISIVNLFETKVKERLSSSSKLLQRLRNAKSHLSISLFHAILQRDLRVIEAILDECETDYDRCVLVNTKDQSLRCCLHYAASLGMVEVVEMILMTGADLREKDVYGRTALHYAAIQDNPEVIKILMRLFEKSCRLNSRMSETSNNRTIARMLKFKNLKKMAKGTKKQAESSKSIQILTANFDYSMLPNSIHTHLERMNASGIKIHSTKTEITTFEDLCNVKDGMGRTALHFAALCDKIPIIRLLLSAGASADSKDQSSIRPLELASSRLASSILISRMKHPKKIKSKPLVSTSVSSLPNEAFEDLLLIDEENLNKIPNDETNENYLHLAIKAKNLKIVELLLKKHFDPSITEKRLFNAVHLAVKLNCSSILSLLIKGSEDSDKQSSFKFQSPWVFNAWIAMEATTIEKYSVFHLAILNNNNELLLWLIDTCKKRDICLSNKSVPGQFLKRHFLKLSDFLEMSASTAQTCFFLSVKNSNLQAASILLQHNCSLYKHNDKGQNVLHIASLLGEKKLVELLVRFDSDDNILRTEKDFKGRLPKDCDRSRGLERSFSHIWDYARLNNVETLSMLIITKEFSVNAQTPNKKLTPLHFAVQYKSLESIRILISLGADYELKSSSGQTAFDMAISKNDYKFDGDILNLLRGKGRVNGKYGIQSIFQVKFRHKKARCKDLQDSLHIPKFSSRVSRNQNEKEIEQYWHEIHKKIIEKNTTIGDLFKMMDGDKDNCITFIEFQGIIIWLGLSFRLDQIQKLAMSLDFNQDGIIQYQEIRKKLEDLLYKEKLKKITLKD